MAVTGRQEVLEVIFAGNTVEHALSGQAVACAVRDHWFLDSVLRTLVLCTVFETKLSLSSDNVPVELDAVADLYDDLVSCKTTMQEVESSVELQALQMKLDMSTETSKSKYLTAKLWLEYIEMVNIMRAFILSERTGDRSLHLRTLQDMLPYLAASGHILYTKSLYVYLNQMIRLENTHSDVHRQFTKGMHVVRRSNRFWAGLSPDLVIEQMLRSLKTSGGFPRGRSMTETQLPVWVCCAEVNIAMQQLTSVTYETNEQHVDISQARQTMGTADSEKLTSFIEWRSPFDEDPSLRNIISGITSTPDVNVDHAKQIGVGIRNEMVVQPVLKHSFKMKARVICFDSHAAVKVGDDEVQIDPLLLFRRLIIS